VAKKKDQAIEEKKQIDLLPKKVNFGEKDIYPNPQNRGL
jgi:hypothetical protein